MRVIVPCTDETSSPDFRILDLAEFLGIPCEALALKTAGSLQLKPVHRDDCLVIRAATMHRWCAANGLTVGDVASLAAAYSRILVCGLRVGDFDNALVQLLSAGRVQSVQAVDRGAHYTCAEASGPFCGPFAGLTFGSVDSTNDHVLAVQRDGAVESLISIGERPFVALVREKATSIVFVAGEELADLESSADRTPVELFSRFLPWAMALRYFAGDGCWRPVQDHGAVVIDDPLLRSTYGFLNFRSLLHMTLRHNFHAAIGFIPHNFRRSSPEIVRLFLENSARLSICFHGNDHTQAEFAATEQDFLNLLLQVATRRMALHQKRTGLACDPVMVFPQGNFSVAAMEALRANNFCAAVNTVPHPAGDPVRLTLRELAQPAVLRYSGFPLFLRQPVHQVSEEDIAFNVFFGRPLLIVEHHQDFQHAEALLTVVERINRIVPHIQWCSLATLTSQSFLRRTAPDGSEEIRAYAGTVTIPAEALRGPRCSVEWPRETNPLATAEVISGGRSCTVERTERAIRVNAEITGRPLTLSLLHPTAQAGGGTLDLKWKTRAFVRRRLSEFRDNYLYRNGKVLQAARAVQHRLSGV